MQILIDPEALVVLKRVAAKAILDSDTENMILTVIEYDSPSRRRSAVQFS